MTGRAGQKNRLPYRYWTNRETERFTADYPNFTNTVLAGMYGRTAEALNVKALKLGLKKSAKFLATQSGRFTAETAGWNRGKTHKPEGSKATYFKPGHLPSNTQPLGAERFDRDGILWRKVDETRQKHKDWKRVKDLEFVRHHGPIPAGHFVIHANRDRTDFSPANLIAITQSEHARRNCNREKAAATMRAKKVPAFARYVRLVSGATA